MQPIIENIVEITMLFDYLIVTGEIDRDASITPTESKIQTGLVK